MIPCPICGTGVAMDESACPKCSAELTEYISVYYTPDLLYNEAEVLIESGEYREAYDKLAAAHYMRPGDTEIVRRMAYCAEAIGDYLGAMEKLARLLAEAVAPDAALTMQFNGAAAKLTEQKTNDEEAQALLGRLGEIVSKIEELQAQLTAD